MTIRGLQVRAILVPIGMAAFLTGALTWYGLAWIPSQQRYFNERNVRLLRTIGSQIRAQVNNFDFAVDHAIESFDFARGTPADQFRDFKTYVQLFAPQLDILTYSVAVPPPQTSDADFADPPRVRIEPDEGSNYLYINYRRAPEPGAREVFVGARADIDRVAGDFLSSRGEFDAVALVGHDWRVIAQRSLAGVELVHVDWLSEAADPVPAPGAKTAATAPSTPRTGRIETLEATGNVQDVTVAGVPYKLYMQPVPLTLLDGTQPPTERRQAEWALCGLVRADSFRAASSAISSTYWLMFIVALAVLCLSIPLLKLRILSPRERFKGADGLYIAGTTFLAGALVTLALLDACYFGYAFKRDTDQRLRDVARTMLDGFAAETGAAVAQLDASIRDLDGRPPTFERAHAGTRVLPPRVGIKEGQPACDPASACQQLVLTRPDSGQRYQRYPYFNLITWSDPDGQQLVKYSSDKGLTPFIDIQQTRLPYYEDLRRARHLGTSERGVTVLRSPNTGSPLTVYWQALQSAHAPQLTGVALATSPLALVQPVLPADVRFAVVDASGEVKYHSDQTRALTENFFRECEGNPTLRALVTARASNDNYVTGRYLGEAQRFLVTPIRLGMGTSSLPISDPPWSLIVFERTRVAETVNLETLTLAASMTGTYALALMAGWALLYRVWPQRSRKWFWPDDRKGGRYRAAALVNAGLTVLFVALSAVADAPWLLAGTAIIALVGIAATFAIVTSRDAPVPVRGSWRLHFLLARTSLLVVVATTPAIACFQAAHNFEVHLLSRRARAQLAVAMDARTARAEREARRVRCAGTEYKGCSDLEASLKRRLGETTWDVHLPPPPAHAPDASQQFGGVVGWLMALGHMPYNGVAVDLIDASTAGATGPTLRWYAGQDGGPVVARVNAGLAAASPVLQPAMSWVIAGVASGLLFLLLRFGVGPLFLLDLSAPPGLRLSGNRDLDKNLLLIGAPGAGKSAALADHSVRRVLDVRSLAWIQDGAPAPLTPTAPGWSIDAMDRSALPDGGVIGIDHLEYRLNDAAVRNQLLAFMEQLLYLRDYRVWIATAREPIEQLRENNDAAADLDRWRRLFQSFRKETTGLRGEPSDRDALAEAFRRRPGDAPSPLETRTLDECSVSSPLLRLARTVVSGLPEPLPAWDDLRYEIGVAAEPYYQSLWAACSKDDKVALRQLAEEGLVNPRNRAGVAQLLRSGLIRRDPTFRVMNETFREFIVRELPAVVLTEWEREGVRLPWGSVTTMMLTGALGLVGAILLTQQQLVDTWVGSYVPTLAPALPVLWKVFTIAQRDPRGATAA